MDFFKKTIRACLFTALLIPSPVWSQQQLDDTSLVFSADGGQKHINIDILNMDIESVLKVISDTSGWTIIPSQKIRGKVSLWSKGATARQLLDKLALVNNYIYQQEENVIYLMTKDEHEQLFGRTTKTFCLKHQKAENIKQLLENSLTKAGTLGVDSWSNTIVVNDTSENLRKIELLIAQLDKGFIQKRFQIVNAKVVDVAKILTTICPKEGPFEADVRTNSIVVFNSESNVSRVAELIAQLDHDNVTRVFQIRFQKASELAPQISAFLNGSSVAEESDNTSRIIVSDVTNQIVVTGSASEINYIAGILEELDSKVITTTIPLKHLKASELLDQISHLASTPDSITVDSQTNRLIIHDNTYNVEQIRSIVQSLDESLVTKVFALKYAMAEDVENVLQSIVTNPDTFQADRQTNQIIICDSASQVARIEGIINMLDCEDTYFTRTYLLKYASASHIADILESFISRQDFRDIYQDTTFNVDDSRGYEAVDRKGLNTSPSSSDTNSEPGQASVALGSAPGLAGARSFRQAAESRSSSSSPVSVSSSSSKQTVEPVTAENGAESLGRVGTVVADDRSNTVTITETLVILTKIEQLIEDLDVPLNWYSYTIKHRQLDSMELDGKLENFLRPEQDVFSIDSQTHSLHFATIPSIAEKILEMLEKWDKPLKQVLIRAKILAINTSTLKDIGINFEALFDISNVGIILESSLPSQLGADHLGSLTIRKLTGTQYQTILRAIEGDNRSQILASPRILVLGDQSAEVRMATDEPFTETSIDAENGRTLENVRFLQIGTILMVTPHIKEDDTIEMNVSLDVSSLVEIRNGIPVVNRNIASSVVAVKDNHILMIGGLKFKRDISVNEKIPIIGDLPIIGGLFNSNHNELADTELILMLQPTIMNDSDSLPEAELSRAWEAVTNQSQK